MHPWTDQITTAIGSGDRDKVRDLLVLHPELLTARTEAGVTLLMLALYQGRPDIAAEFETAERGLSIHEAAALGRLDRVRELCSNANQNSPDGFPPLALACFFGHEEVARVLLEQGAVVDAVSQNGMRIQPIHAAAARRAAVIVDLLLGNGADPNARQQNGFTPLHAAGQHGDTATAELLLSAGADPKLRSEDHKTAAEYAEAAGHHRLAALLREAENPPQVQRPSQ